MAAYSVVSFYDQTAPWYDRLYQDWGASVGRQSSLIAEIGVSRSWLRRATPDIAQPYGRGRILDVACGIGTQSIGLMALGFNVRGSDISPVAVQRAFSESQRLNLNPLVATDGGPSEQWCLVADMRNAFSSHRGGYDLVIAYDNCLPHLSEEDILVSLKQMYMCARPGGGCLVSVRDYIQLLTQAACAPTPALKVLGFSEKGIPIFQEPLKPEMHPYGVRCIRDKECVLYQVWRFECQKVGSGWLPLSYEVNLITTELAPVGSASVSQSLNTTLLCTRYNIISTDRIMELMRAAGFIDVERIDDPRAHQPIIIGTRPDE
ncbi:class I SAM-dependent methyltransferase [Pelomyxa schiedti]|nr:class I SAM-dependent methyltransferase [Pelomyxa schiedti]